MTRPFDLTPDRHGLPRAAVHGQGMPIGIDSCGCEACWRHRARLAGTELEAAGTSPVISPVTRPAQRALFEGPAPDPRARQDGPATSRAAATHAGALAGSHRRAALEVLRASSTPLTVDEIAEQLVAGDVHLLGHQVGRRMAELLRMGRVVIADERGRSAAGRRCQRYAIAAAASDLEHAGAPATSARRPGDVALPADTLFGSGRGRWRR